MNIKVKNLFILSMCIAYLINFFMKWNIFSYYIVSLSIVVFLICLEAAKTLPRLFSIMMLLSGIVLNIFKGDVMEGTANGLLVNLPLLCLVILVPLLSIPFKIGGYFHSIHFYMERMAHDLKTMFGTITLLLFCIGPMLNIGSIRILHETIRDIELEPEFLAKSYLVGFSTVVLWSPYFSSVALVLYYLDVPVLQYLPLGLALAFIQLIFGNLLFYLWLKNKKQSDKIKEDTIIEENENKEKYHRKKMMDLLFVLIFLSGLLFLLEYVTKLPMIYLVSLFSITYPVIWSITKRKRNEFVFHIKEYIENSIPKMNNEIVLFISAGLFGNALAGTTFADGIKLFLTETASMSFLLFIITVVIIILVFTFIGVHPVVVVTALVSQMDADMIGTRPEVLALLIMISWSMSAILSPVNPLNLVVSESIDKPGLSVGLRWNGFYVLLMFVVGAAFIYLIH
ncbi:hypothetical protein [Peribacillus glennii]|nr:hypothetical protein [Peribacillus glennii]